MSFDWTDDLKDAFNDAPDEGEDLPHGEYLARILKAKVQTVKSGKSAGVPMLVFDMAVVGGDLDGREFSKFNFLRPDNIKFTKWDLKRLGIEVSSLSDLEDALPDCVGVELAVSAIHKDGYCNYNFKKVTSDSKPPDDAPW